MKNSLGKHWIIELHGCDADLLCQPGRMENFMQEAAAAMGATVVQSNFHHFAPHGVSGVVIIQESHLTVHTWPEYGYAAVDIFTCGKMVTEAGVDVLIKRLKAETSEVKLLERGIGILVIE